MSRTKKENKGFTLVEVIVVAVIVAVLALVAIQLYRGYVADARYNTAQNLAASAAAYLTTEVNRGSTINSSGDVDGPADIDVDAPDNVTPTVFTVPSNATVTITTGSPNVVTATVGDTTSSDYNW